VSIDTSFTLGTDLRIDNNQLFTAYEFNGTYIKTTTLANGILQVDSLFRAGTNVTFTEDTGNATWDINVDLSGLTYSEPAYEVTTAAGYIRPATDGQGTVGDHNHKFNKIFVNTSSGFEVQGSLTFNAGATLGDFLNPPIVWASTLNCTNVICATMTLQSTLSVAAINGFILKGDIGIPAPAHNDDYSIGSDTGRLLSLCSSNVTLQNLKGVATTTGTPPVTTYANINLFSNLIPHTPNANDIGAVGSSLANIYSTNITGETLVTSNATFNNTQGIKCFEFDASTGKTTFFQKTGVGTATTAIFTVDLAAPTVDASTGRINNSPINFKTSVLPVHAEINHLQTGDLFTIPIHSGGTPVYYELCIKA
jgi:hypothetical protein